ncbi:phosphomannomutase [Tremella mesenterica]|uniref:Phosphomannomutase n=1 Tax=Tremella mesenterica TaxID=5217 RepID=A0A4Q1BR83_TREME|nr:uncharacterized protein TREMEDRAFT_34937 [Tremella mesenterica DSM 1558]EIW66513.1 hypothetical protein TREMEDRAFT_34937 [Tremella mesenterica DSM 1558]RXK40476.1 phosphomannomutase [Tremella mesenterica]
MVETTPANVFPPGIKPFAERKYPGVICMFDVDDTLTPPRQKGTPEMIAALRELRDLVATAFVGGSNLEKITGQLHVEGQEVLNSFDYCFAENGLIAYKLGRELDSASFIKYVGEENYKTLVNFILKYLSEVDCPVKRGTFIEFRNGMINISPVGRNASQPEREAFQEYDKIHNIRPKMVEALREKFAHLNLTYSIGGQISFDVFPTGWDKTYCLRHVEDEGFKEIHFFGDKTYKGGNDYEIYTDPRTIGHSVKNPADTLKQLHELFLSKE